MNDELGAKIMANFVVLRAKSYSYFLDDQCKDKKAEGTKKCVIKRKLKFENYRLFRINSTSEQNELSRKK